MAKGSQKQEEEKAVEKGVPVLDAEFVEVPDIPTYTIRADSEFGIRCMVMVRDMAISRNPDQLAAINRKLREFDLYEESTRS